MYERIYQQNFVSGSVLSRSFGKTRRYASAFRHRFLPPSFRNGGLSVSSGGRKRSEYAARRCEGLRSDRKIEVRRRCLSLYHSFRVGGRRLPSLRPAFAGLSGPVSRTSETASGQDASVRLPLVPCGHFPRFDGDRIVGYGAFRFLGKRSGNFAIFPKSRIFAALTYCRLCIIF